MSLTTQLHTEAQVFTDLQDAWHQVLETQPQASVFLTPEFLQSWWQTCADTHDQLQLATCWDGKRLAGIAPCLKRGKLLLSLGDLAVTDYYDWIFAPESKDNIVAALAAALQRTHATTLKLISLATTAQVKTVLQKKYAPNITTQQQNVCPIIDLPDSWEKYLLQLDRKQRHELKRKKRKIAELATIEYEEMTSVSAIESSLTDFFRLHKISSPEKNNFWTAERTAFFTKLMPRLAVRHWVSLFFLKVGERRVATMLVFHYNNEYQLYNSGFDQEFREWSIGTLLHAHCIKQAIAAGAHRYNFLRGSEEYKFRLGARAEAIYDLTLRLQPV